MRVEALCTCALVALSTIGPRAAVADTHAIEQRRGWPATLAAQLVSDLWCRPAPVAAGDAPQPAVVVVGFAGGRERRDSAISGVVRLGHAVAAAARHEPGVAVLLYNNAEWRTAVRDVVALTDQQRGSTPLVVAYGHSLGAGAITRFARGLDGAGMAVDLAVYIDAFGWRNPRVPPNIRHAVNFYQRTGLLRGLPLRGKRLLHPESPSATAILGSYRLSPDTSRFGWHWNLIQPLFYRQHHRLAHDARIQRLLVAVATPAAAASGERCAGSARPAMADTSRPAPPEPLP